VDGYCGGGEVIIDKPLVRSNICMNSHPVGLAAAVHEQILYVQQRGPIAGGAQTVLVIGCSTGFGLASRITAAFGCGAATVGVSFERPAGAERAGTPGWYNNREFDKESLAAGLPSVTVEGDAFEDATKDETVAALRKMGRKADLVIYSLASPVRTDPVDGVLYRSVLKAVGDSYVGATVDLMTGQLGTCTIGTATKEEVEGTVKVMGGEDWARWMDHLEKADVLAPGCRTLAYSYIGPEFSHAIYRHGTIGFAKAHLEKTAFEIDRKLQASPLKGRAWVSVNKALVTRASAVIPGIALYMGCLFKVMKEKGVHEGCVEQIERLFREKIHAHGPAELDEENRIRLDDWEMRDDVQAEVSRRMDLITSENIAEMTDLAGIRHDFLEAHGFDVPGVDYQADVDPLAGA
jgi:enoyl-[acyl-carrier protein] reductase/trans-2-enoyl-CoA reductase (NAD+)